MPADPAIEAAARAQDHPLIQALVRGIPEPGVFWPLRQQIALLQAFECAFVLIYNGAGRVEISAAQPAERTAEEMRRKVEAR